MESSHRKRIIFVDDEQNVLEALERMLKHVSDVWEMSFVQSAYEALELMNERPADVVVTDMRMPVMDGAELCKRVKVKYPDTICLVFSGYCDRGSILRSVGLADQFIGKPCNVETLIKIIQDVLDTQKAVEIRHLHKLVAELKHLPTIPQVYDALKEKLECSKSSFDDIAYVVSQDGAMTAKILQLVNSAFFGLKHKLANIKQAIVYLGIETLKAVVITTDVFSKFSQHEIERFDIKRLYRHNLFVGGLARNYTKNSPIDTKYLDSISMASILHDIGKVIFIKNYPDEYYEILQKRNRTQLPSYKLEYETFGTSHAELGGYLMGLWGIPDTIKEFIINHHSPRKVRGADRQALSALYAANVLYNTECEERGAHDPLLLDEGFLDEAGVREHVSAWRTYAQQTMQSQQDINGAGDI